MSATNEPMLIACMRSDPTGEVVHFPESRGKLGTTAQGFLAEYDEAIQAARGEHNENQVEMSDQEKIFAGRMFNWKFASAEAEMPASLESDRRAVVTTLAEVFGNCGWFDGKMATIVSTAVAFVMKDEAL